MKFSEKWLREWVDPALTTQQLAEQLTMAGLEVDSVTLLDNDTLIELDLTPNRGDCISISGIAREIALLNQMKFSQVKIEPITPQIQDVLKVEVQVPQACPRYVGRIIRNIKTNATTPSMIQTRLEASDIRCVHPVVDILNYVMLELGQPMHAFDLDKIQDAIVVRHARGAEKITLLNEQEVTLRADTLVIADRKNPHAMAGIMGGKESSVTPQTQNLFLESALFTSELMAGKARQYSLHTDSSYRFERGVDPDLQLRAMERATRLICEYCGGEPGPIIDVVNDTYLPKQAPLQLRYARLLKVVGEPIPHKTVTGILERLGCTLTETSLKGEMPVWEVLPQTFRYDLTSEIDLIEEIVRVVGYNNIPDKLPHIGAQFASQSETHVSTSRLKRALVDMGYQEVITYSFVDEALHKALYPNKTALGLLNPISADMNEMRLSLWPGLLNTLKYNQYRQQQRLKFFETGLCFNLDGGETLFQEAMLGGVVCGEFLDEQWSSPKRPADFFDVKNHIESLWSMVGQKEPLRFAPFVHTACHPGQCAEISYQGKILGLLGRLHPTVEKTLELNGPIYLFELKVEAFTQKAIPVFVRPSKFPEIRRDIAVIIEQSLPSDSLAMFVRSSARELLRDVKIFDVYTGKGIDSGRKSVAMGLILQHPSRTLVDKEVDELIHTVVAGLKKEFGAELRD